MIISQLPELFVQRERALLGQTARSGLLIETRQIMPGLLHHLDRKSTRLNSSHAR